MIIIRADGDAGAAAFAYTYTRGVLRYGPWPSEEAAQAAFELYLAGRLKLDEGGEEIEYVYEREELPLEFRYGNLGMANAYAQFYYDYAVSLVDVTNSTSYMLGPDRYEHFYFVAARQGRYIVTTHTGHSWQPGYCGAYVSDEWGQALVVVAASLFLLLSLVYAGAASGKVEDLWERNKIL